MLHKEHCWVMKERVICDEEIFRPCASPFYPSLKLTRVITDSYSSLKSFFRPSIFY